MAPMVLPNLKQGNLVERVFEAMRNNILSGQYQDGERLAPQQMLGEQLGVSRTVIREALNKLAMVGLVDIRQGSGTFVLTSRVGGVISPTLEVLLANKESMQELTETRYYLEQTIARLAAKRADEAVIGKLTECVTNMEGCVDTGDTVGYAKYDLAFHMTLADASGNSVLAHILEVVRESMLRFMKDFTQIPGAPKTALEHHAAIVHAVTHHDTRAAEHRMEEHIRFVTDILCTQYGYEMDI
jgi:GntR family transcriptional regulator, transcriptional repressor for pyruvate dehydrogenase complex